MLSVEIKLEPSKSASVIRLPFMLLTHKGLVPLFTGIGAAIMVAVNSVLSLSQLPTLSTAK